jgi:CDP-diacylglycerol--glycerol-3-phosphate 3-phosphatidyltransferase
MNLPNRLTLVRIFLIPVILAVISMRISYGDYIAAVVFILAASTDGLDGYIARKKKLVTRLGKLMDPLADKLLISAALIALVELQRLSAWVAVVIIGREFAVTGLRALAAADGNIIAAGRLGKIKTVTQIIAISALFLKDLPLLVGHLSGMPVTAPEIKSYWIMLGQLSMSVAVFYTMWSGIDYFNRSWSVIKKGGY